MQHPFYWWYDVSHKTDIGIDELFFLQNYYIVIEPVTILAQYVCYYPSSLKKYTFLPVTPPLPTLLLPPICLESR